MKINLKNFYWQITILATIMFAIVFILWIAVPKFFIPVHFLTVAIFWLFTFLFYWLVQKNIGPQKTMNFVNIFMAATIAKLFALMVYIVVYIFTVRTNLVQFLIFVLINYIVFTFLEVFFLIKKQKNMN